MTMVTKDGQRVSTSVAALKQGSTGWDLSGEMTLTGDGHGHHIPGTPFVYRHGWREITGHAPAPPKYSGMIDSKSQHSLPDGSYTAERQALHRRIIRDMVAGHKPEHDPVATFLGGGPAAGKSTIESRDANPGVVIDPDKIMEQLPEYQQMTTAGITHSSTYAHREAADIADMAQDYAVHHRLSFTLDGTGDRSYETMAQRIKAAHDEGYRVAGKYVTVPVETAVERARARAQRTGRMVPESAIRAIHGSVSKIFTRLAVSDMFDQAELWDNRGSKPKLIAGKGPHTRFRIEDPQGWQEFVAKGQPDGQG